MKALRDFGMDMMRNPREAVRGIYRGLRPGKETDIDLQDMTERQATAHRTGYVVGELGPWLIIGGGTYYIGQNCGLLPI